MENDHSVKTQLQYSNGKTFSFFADHPKVGITALSNVGEFKDTWSPIHLLVSSVESCFLMILLPLAHKMHLEIKDYSSETSAELSSSDGKHYEVTNIVIKPKIAMANADDNKKIPQLIKMAEEYCPVGNSLKTKMTVSY